jgi:hypothetical protein
VRELEHRRGQFGFVNHGLQGVSIWQGMTDEIPTGRGMSSSRNIDGARHAMPSASFNFCCVDYKTDSVAFVEKSKEVEVRTEKAGRVVYTDEESKRNAGRVVLCE